MPVKNLYRWILTILGILIGISLSYFIAFIFNTLPQLPDLTERIGLIVGAVVHYCYAPEMALPLCMLSVAAGEAVACLILGPLFIRALSKLPDKYLKD